MNRHLSLVLYSAWLLLFGLEAWGLSHQFTRLSWLYERLEAESDVANLRREKALDFVREAETNAQDLEFVQGVFNLLPQDRGYLRTQKVMAEEVHALRKDVGRRLGGRLHIVVDTKANKLYLKQGLTLLWQADCSVGRGGMLVDRLSGQRWQFVTPRGEFRVRGKIKDPIWIKPDWAFVESGQPVPPPDDPSRKVPGELGAYVLNLGDGYLIHGTQNEQVLGSAVSHGCVRLGAENLEKLYRTVPVGTLVYIY